MQFYKEEFFEDLVLKNNVYKDIINDALEVVKRFIIERKLILVGGMAIDMAMRARGSRLYENDDMLPDYDFLSPDFHNDAYDLALILDKKKFPQVQVINARHMSTMRVRVNFEVVADITYIPKSMFDKLPFIKYRGFKVVHPHYQIIDQHVSLSRPYEGAPQENITGGRWKKDMTRHNIIVSVYPIDNSANNSPDGSKILFKFPSALLKDQCVGGFAALEYWNRKATLMGATGFPNTIKLGKMFECLAYEFILYSDDPEQIANTFLKLLNVGPKIKESKIKLVRYKSLLEKVPRSIHVEGKGIIIFDTYASKLAAHKSKLHNMYFANPQTIMVHMLTEWVVNKSVQHLQGYLLAKKLVSWASVEFGKGKNTNLYMPFLPTHETYGEVNWSHNYILYRKQFVDMIDGKKTPRPTPPPLYNENLKKSIAEMRKFKPSESELYQFDGGPVEGNKIFERVKLAGE